MIIVIIAGGSGTRLWPLSQPNYPKHLLRLTGKTSLLENTYRRAKAVTKDVYILPEASHSLEVAKQLPDLPPEHLIVEPARRGTASAIALALARIKQTSPHETVIFLHADHHIVDDEGFARTVRAAAAASAEAQKITLIGLKPNYPATGFGYIKVGTPINTSEDLPVLEVERFVEKPQLEVATQYVADGRYLWNLGLFAAPVAVFEANLRQFAPELYGAYQELCRRQDDPKRLSEAYLELPALPIDTALIEKTNRIQVIPGRFDWADIGSFFDLHQILAGKDHNALKGDVYLIECEDSMIHGSTKPVIAVGLSGIVVVDTPEGLLVCAKEKSQLVGDAVKQLQAKTAPP
ncbi:NTP transferase domain-containing protein [Candidatus Parcubacteria bacterium]|nr:NTP transferase domain-containing protein [Candidatus Parcubacteria bacterium]